MKPILTDGEIALFGNIDFGIAQNAVNSLIARIKADKTALAEFKRLAKEAFDIGVEHQAAKAKAEAEREQLIKRRDDLLAAMSGGNLDNSTVEVPISAWNKFRAIMVEEALATPHAAAAKMGHSGGAPCAHMVNGQYCAYEGRSALYKDHADWAAHCCSRLDCPHRNTPESDLVRLARPPAPIGNGTTVGVQPVARISSEAAPARRCDGRE